MKRVILALLVVFIFDTLLYAKDKPQLLLYCGITMYQPIKKISNLIEKKYHCKINIIQGGSKDLYDSIKFSKMGDIFLPGSESYVKQCEKDKIIMDKRLVGYNQAAIFIQKDNPKNIKGLDDLLREDISTILCDPQSGSIGAMTEKILKKFKGEDFFNKAYAKAVEIGTDSRNLNSVLIDKQADMTINWIATAYWKENRKFIDIIKLDDKLAPKQKLVISILKFTKYPDIAKAIIEYASSKNGMKIMKGYGF